MQLAISNRAWTLVAVVAAGAALMLLRPATGEALPDYAAATGQPCGACHVNPAGGGQRNATGRAFQAIPTHSSDPAGAWAQLSAQPAPAPAAVPTSTTTQNGPVSVSVAATPGQGSVTYSITVSNTGGADLSNLYVAGSIPAGAGFVAATGTPAGSSFISADGGLAGWTVGALPAGSSIGPFEYQVSAGGRGGPGAAVAFVHWNGPAEGAAMSAAANFSRSGRGDGSREGREGDEQEDDD